MKRQSISERFGQVVKDMREQVGLSQEKLAELADIDRTYVSMIERGKRNLTLEVGKRVADALGVKLSELVRKAEQK